METTPTPLQHLIASILDGILSLRKPLFLILLGVLLTLWLSPRYTAFAWVGPSDFYRPLPNRVVSIRWPAGYWQLTGYDTSYKNAILRQFQDMLTEAGVPRDEQRWYAAQLYQENGAFTPDRLGDNGCSFGLVQYNACAKHGMSAKRFLKDHPEWKTVEKQLAWMVEQIVARRDVYAGKVRKVVLDHNCPACARGRMPDRNGYVRHVEQKLSALTSL